MLPNARENLSSAVQVLVAEEDDDIRAEIARGLRDHGHVVVECADGPTLFQQLERRLARPDARRSIVIAQARLPGVGGLRVLHSLKGLDVQIPMVLLTWLHEPTVHAAAMAAGAAAVLTKPIQLVELRRVIDALTARVGPRVLGTPSGHPAIPP